MIRISGAHPRQRLALSTLALTLAAALLAGCGSDETKSAVPDLDSSPSASSTATSTPSETATADTPGTVAKAPEGMRMVTAKKSGLRFAAPEDWIVVDATKLDDPQFQSVLTEYAKGVNLTLDQLKQYFTQVDVMVMAPGTSGATASNINVTQVPMAAEVPTEATIRSSFASLNADVSGVSEQDTPVGSARVATYTLPIPGGKVAYGRGVFVMVGDSVVNLTITTGDEAGAGKLLDEVLPTLAKAD